MRRPTPDRCNPGQESVWDYPRPPRLEPTSRRIRVELDGVVLADTTAAYRVLETSHPPSYYLPPDSCDLVRFTPAAGGASFCEWKGLAQYWDVTVDGRSVSRAVWSYPDPTERFAPLRDHLAFYPSAFRCTVDDIDVIAQPGGFYGGWITPDVVGPFKGIPGSNGW